MIIKIKYIIEYMIPKFWNGYSIDFVPIQVRIRNVCIINIIVFIVFFLNLNEILFFIDIDFVGIIMILKISINTPPSLFGIERKME